MNRTEWNKQRPLKGRLKEKKLSIGSWLTLGHPAIAEIMAGAGFEWLAVDTEHSAITTGEMQELIRVIDLAGAVPLVRVAENSPTLIKKAMDCGAHGVIVPMVNSEGEAIRAVNAVKYPPTGTRGVGLARAQGYGMSFKEYRDSIDKESVVIVQVESIDAIRNLDAILSVAGVDGFFLGPYDLSASLGKPGEFEDPEVRNAIAKAMETGAKHGVCPGIHVIPASAEVLMGKVSEGFRFIAFSLDTLFLGSACGLEMNKLKERLGSAS